MSLSLILACLWVVAATVIALIPSKRNHWPQAFMLIALGLPLLGLQVETLQLFGSLRITSFCGPVAGCTTVSR